jgi:hypothetical protein
MGRLISKACFNRPTTLENKTLERKRATDISIGGFLLQRTELLISELLISKFLIAVFTAVTFPFYG